MDPGLHSQEQRDRIRTSHLVTHDYFVSVPPLRKSQGPRNVSTIGGSPAPSSQRVNPE